MDGVDELVQAVVAVLEGDDASWLPQTAGDGGAELAVVMAEGLARHGLRARCEAPLHGGGRAELLVTTEAPAAPMVAVVPAVRGATDALRRLAGHSEVDAVVVASQRGRHQTLVGEVDGVPVLVARLPALR